MEFSTLTKRNTIPHFHPASRLKQREKRSRACKLYDAYRIIALYRVCKNTARSKGQGQQNKHRRFLERSNEVMEFSINTPKLKVKRSRSTQFSRKMCQDTSVWIGLNQISREMCPDTSIRYVTWASALPFVLSFWHCFAFHRNVKWEIC